MFPYFSGESEFSAVWVKTRHPPEKGGCLIVEVAFRNIITQYLM
jgi:hypothetical protein